MNTLPTQPTTDTSTGTTPTAPSVGKELEHVSTVTPEASQATEQQKDTELPREVAAIGVTMQPTTVVLPNIVKNAGVQALNPQAPVITFAPTVKLPLSDDQIAKGLHESVASSVRWLAQWCMRRLKQVHIVAKDVGGRLVRA